MGPSSSGAAGGADPPGGDAADLRHVAGIPLFSGLDDAAQRSLLRSMRVVRAAPQETVFWVGDRGDSFYVVSEGEVAVSVPNEEGEEVVLDHLGPGAFFGEISLLDSNPRTATVRAIGPVELYRLDQKDFHAFLRERPDAAIGILTVMGRRQRVSTNALRGLKHPNAEFDRSRVSPWQKVSDVIATVAASAAFTVFHVAWFGSWILLNLLAAWGLLPRSLAFDPFPFGLLTMVVSLEAIFLSIFVMVSQNRQSERDRLRADLDYQVNLKAETEITALARRLERLETHLLGEREEAPGPKPAHD